MSGRAARFAQWVWESESGGAATFRVLLTPVSALFGAIVTRRNKQFDGAMSSGTSSGLKPSGIAPSGHASSRVRATVLPAVSVGNLTVGGTGKTPVAAWCARELRRMGANPAIVLRGYGDDEWRVHALLNPGTPVVVAKDRLMGIATASARGANCVVLDDAFQHRRAARLADIVLVSADRWTGSCRLLPAGPFREPLHALRRATVAVITVKAASEIQVQLLEQAIRREAPDVPISVMRLEMGALELATTLPRADAAGKLPARKLDQTGMLKRSVSWLAGRRLVAVTAIGDPASFIAQLARAGAIVTHRRFPDHHAFTEAEAAGIAQSASAGEGVICTLKDAVKLGPLWPRVAPPLWYVSQQVVVERGASALDRALSRVLQVRVATAPTAG